MYFISILPKFKVYLLKLVRSQSKHKILPLIEVRISQQLHQFQMLDEHDNRL